MQIKVFFLTQKVVKIDVFMHFYAKKLYISNFCSTFVLQIKMHV